MLELPACDLLQRVNEELQENPALDEGRDPLAETEETIFDETAQDEEYTNPLQNEDFNYDDYVQDDEIPDYRTRAYMGSSDDDDSVRDIPMSAGISFGEHLKSQIYLTKMDKPDRHIAKFIVGNIDDDGYLRRTPEEIVDDLSFREGLMVTEEHISDIIRQIQQFDPPGVGAKDLQECLLIQLRQKNSTPAIEIAIRILEKCFNAFSKRHFDVIKERLSITEDELRDAIDEITRLNPKPGSAWVGTVYDRHQTTIIPDFYVEQRDGELILTLNQGDIPELHISREYRDMMQDMSAAGHKQSKETRQAARFVKAKIDAARSFIDAIKQRNETLTRTMQAIMKVQHDFFIEGDETYLKPMVLQDIADITGYDASTISRVSNSKYVQTEFGIYPLKFFFSESIVNAEGEEISTREVKKILSEMIAGEDKQEPLTDEMMVTELAKQGYILARRTIAKYREQLGIPVARLRRDFHIKES